MSYDNQVTDHINKLESSKFVRIVNDARFPALSVQKIQYPALTEVQPTTSVEIYPKHALLTHLVNASDINIQLSASEVNIGDVGLIDHSTGSTIHAKITQTDTVNGTAVGAINTLVTNPVTSVYIEEEQGLLFSINNHAARVHGGWVIDDVMRPVISFQNSSVNASDIFKIIDYQIGSSGAKDSTIVYEWYEGPLNVLGAAVPSWTNLGNKIQYRVYQDQHNNNTGNTFTVPANTIMRHSGIIIGRNSEGDELEADLFGGNNRNMMTLCLKRVDNSSEIDVWFAFTCKELSV